MPDAESNPSPDNKVYVLVGKCLNKNQQVKTTAHEGFGHAQDATTRNTTKDEDSTAIFGLYRALDSVLNARYPNR